MSANNRNRLKTTVSAVASSGLGAFTISTASSGYRSFVAGDDGLTFDGVLITEGTTWEVRDGCVYTHSGTSLSRGTLMDSSTGSAIAFTSAAVVSQGGAADFARRAESAGLRTSISSSDANLTMQVGVLHCVDISGFTADRTATLPAVAAVDDRVGLYISTGDDAYEMLITAASGDTLKGVAGGTEWSRLFVTGEIVIMRCTVANSTWVIEEDGRIDLPADVTANGSTTQTLTRNANNKITTVLATVASDAGSNWSVSNKQLQPRRAGVYFVSVLVSVVNLESTKPLLSFLQKNGPAYVGNAPVTFGTGAATVASGTSTVVRMAVGDTLELQVYYEDTSTNRATSAGANENYFRAIRVSD